MKTVLDALRAGGPDRSPHLTEGKLRHGGRGRSRPHQIQSPQSRFRDEDTEAQKRGPPHSPSSLLLRAPREHGFSREVNPSCVAGSQSNLLASLGSLLIKREKESQPSPSGWKGTWRRVRSSAKPQGHPESTEWHSPPSFPERLCWPPAQNNLEAQRHVRLSEFTVPSLGWAQGGSPWAPWSRCNTQGLYGCQALEGVSRSRRWEEGLGHPIATSCPSQASNFSGRSLVAPGPLVLFVRCSR